MPHNAGTAAILGGAMLDTFVLSGSESVVPLLVFGPLAILWGAFLTWAAWKDPGGRFTAYYEDSKDSRVGFWAVSRNGIQFRGWHLILGIGFFVGGIACLVWAL
jgi:hypothetical protein